MKNHTLALSLLIGAALTVPTLAMAAPADTKAAKKTNATAEMAVEAKVESTGNETDANTSKTSKMTPFVISETQTISRARVNSNIGQQPMTTEIKAPNGPQPMTTEIKVPAEALQNSELQTTEIISEDVEEDLAEVSEEDEL
ncbi:hypothetical protein [Psychrobacter cryohalolentis]|uniref:Uncharacterized protein n=1 Tax=Psychrobacter cryohalolentis (strain ATCC BAA-1226 / DSM 17306 / VKM B-2378 / K5) TaxID=335284 RepID=Q1QEI2_PSYCK|nr:hypothetical protein [Psychrobacter cryohalolentis]ABE73921.1 conserved hypothetical protein [Psychrobacter cryohalolentis K5]ASE26559.1 hypothetical protein CEP87_08180 [Psychrobacter cryohalolentis]